MSRGRVVPSLSVLLVLIVLSGCVMNKVDPNAAQIVLREEGQGAAVSIDLHPGDEYLSTMRAGPLIFNVLPQFVIWSEDGDGNLMETLYITGADYGKMRHAGKTEKGVQFYRESFPVWSSRAIEAGRRLPSKLEPYPDTLTSATPAGATTLSTFLDSEAGPTRILFEINKSGDDNEVYTEKRNDWIGQPSLVYAANLKGYRYGDSLNFELIGHGGGISQAPGIYEDLSGFDSALEQISDLRLVLTTP